jgi:hypothetical protein
LGHRAHYCQQHHAANNLALACLQRAEIENWWPIINAADIEA